MKDSNENNDEFVDIDFLYPDGTNEIVPIQKKSFLFIVEEALKEGKSVEDKFIEILSSIIEECK